MISAARSLPARAWLPGLCSLAVLHTLLYPAFYADSFSVAAIVLYGVPVAVAIALVARRQRRASPRERLGWAAMLVALCFTAILDTSWSITGRLSGETPAYPNLWFDIPYLLSYCVYIAAVGLLTSPIWWRRDRRWMFDALALLTVTAALLWHFMIPIAEGDGTLTERLLANAYLTLDLLFLAAVLMAWYGGQLTLARLVITVAALALATGDILFYFAPIAFDSSWSLGIWLIALAAAMPPGEPVRARPPRIVLSGAVPYLFVACIAAITVVEMPGGGAPDLLAAGAIALALVVLRQVVSLREALRIQREDTALREALLAAQSELGLALIILEEGRIIFANRAAERLSGRSQEELCGLTSIEDMAFEASREEWHEWLRSPEATQDTRMLRGDGRVADIEVVGRYLPGGQRRLLLVARDVTERREADQAMARAQRLEGLGALAGGVAHDFNNLLSTVLGNVGLLRLGELDEEARESVASIEAAAQRGAELTRSLLDFARPPASAFAIEDIADCAAEALSLARPAMPANVSLSLEANGVAARVLANRTQLVQALLNILLNARDATGEHGAIRMRLSRTDRDVRIQISDAATGGASRAERVFEPFASNSAAAGGAGLALAISQRTIRDHRGTLEVHSAPGATSFVVTLPLAIVALAS